ncbi:LysR substrate-binding domain-containing protein [Methylomonas sp. AM2-LC]|uniref:LysR substrate-binding domain-containing protein n=1 Tax=Methylomonas sp. AM2-LC TaxID=3153301 RepID=UPI0032650F25
MNLRDLHYLVAVAELRSFVQAAERCFISQPTLSMQIKKLEESLGVQIFERSNKKVLPTEVGQQIIISAKRILQEAETIKQMAASAQDPLAGNLRLGAFPTLSTYLFPALVTAIKETLPRMRLILVEEKTDILIQQLKNGSLDAALLALPINEELLESVELFDDEFLLAVQSDHSLTAKSQVEASDLFGQQLLLLDEGHCLRGQALQVCQIMGAEEQQDVRATGLETLRQMVYAGTGITFMPSIAVRKADKGICYIPFVTPAPQRTIGLVWRKTTARKALMAKLTQLVQQVAKS